MNDESRPYHSALAEAAIDQWGLITRRQLVSLHITPATISRITSDGRYLTKVAAGVYHLVGAPIPDHMELLAAWLQLAPGTFVWQRRPEQGIVSHRSAAAMLNIGDLPADRHEFTLPTRKQTRRADVRLHHRKQVPEFRNIRGVLVTPPAVTAADLLSEAESPEAVARIISESLRRGLETAAAFRDRLAPLALRSGYRRDDGAALLRYLLDLIGDPERSRWLNELKAVNTNAAAL